ncbi:hypothetical protein ACFL13_00100 [Patescibacteria group bacterium]
MTLKREVELEIKKLEEIKPLLAKFFNKRVYGEWQLKKEEVRLVDEVGFGLTGVPIYGPEIQQRIPHIDIAVVEKAYKGPRSKVQKHPIKILFPRDPKTGNYYKETIYKEDKLDVDDILKGKAKFFDLPAIEVFLSNKIATLVPEPVAHVEYFATDTILFYSLDQVGENKLKEWFIKLLMIREVAKVRKMNDVYEMAEKMVGLSRARWRNNGWVWLNKDSYETVGERVKFQN